MAIFGARDASGASFFDGIYDVFCTCLNFYTKKCNIKNYQKITKKLISCWWLAFFGSRPLPQTDPSQVPFLTVFAMFYAHRALLKNEPVFCLGGGSAAPARLPIAKAKATPHAMRSNMPGIPDPMFCSKWCNRKRSVAELGMVVGCLLGKTRIFCLFWFVGVGGAVSYTQFVYCYFKATKFTQTPNRNKNEFWNCHLAILC